MRNALRHSVSFLGDSLWCQVFDSMIIVLPIQLEIFYDSINSYFLDMVHHLLCQTLKALDTSLQTAHTHHELLGFQLVLCKN